MSDKAIITLEEIDEFFNDASYDFESEAIGLYESFQNHLKKNNNEEVGKYLEGFQDEFGEAMLDHLMKPSFVIGRVEHQKYAGIEYSNPMIGYMLRRLNGIDHDESYRKMKQSIKLAHSDEMLQEKITQYGEEIGEECIYPPRNLIEQITNKHLKQLIGLRADLGDKKIKFDSAAGEYQFEDHIVNE